MSNPLNIAFNLEDVSAANMRYCKTTGVYKVKLIDVRSKRDDDKLHTIIAAQIVEPAARRGEMIEMWLFSPLSKDADESKVRAYKRQWKALALSCGVPDDEAKRVQFVWEKTTENANQASEKGRLLLVLSNRYAYIDFVRRETEDDFDDKTWISEKQFRLFGSTSAEPDDDVEIDEDEVEIDEDEEDVDEDDEVEAEDEDELPPEPAPKKPAKTEAKPKTEAASAPATPPKRRGRPPGSKNKPKIPEVAAEQKAPDNGVKPPASGGRKADPLDAVDDL